MQRLRCVNCGATLFFHEISDGIAEIMCRKSSCKTISRIICENNVCFTENAINRNKKVIFDKAVARV